MKKLLLLTVVLSVVVSTASAGLLIGIYDDELDMWLIDAADSKITIAPSDRIQVGVFDLFAEAQPGTLALGISVGPASLDASQVVTLPGVSAEMIDDAVLAESLGLQNMFINMTVTDPPGAGLLLREAIFHCEGEGDVTLAIVDDNGAVVDTQVIHQVIPEPATLALLGLGAVVGFVRKRR